MWLGAVISRLVVDRDFLTLKDGPRGNHLQSSTAPEENMQNRVGRMQN